MSSFYSSRPDKVLANSMIEAGWEKRGLQDAEIPAAWEKYCPNGRSVLKLLKQTRGLTEEQRRGLRSAWDKNSFSTDYDFAWCTARESVDKNVREEVYLAVQLANQAVFVESADDAVLAVMVQDFIPHEMFKVLVAPWESVMGPVPEH